MTRGSDVARGRAPRTEIVFLGNGPLAEAALAVLSGATKVLFHARTREDLAEVVRLKRENPNLHAVLASYGVMIPREVLELFEPEGILNIHPSLLPEGRGPSPIESAILAGTYERNNWGDKGNEGGDKESGARDGLTPQGDFGVSVMKLVPEMDAGPIYFQTVVKGLPLDKAAIYRALAETGAEWIARHLGNATEVTGVAPEVAKMADTDSLAGLPVPVPQDEKKATFTQKITKKMGILDPATETAVETYRKIVAFQGFPKAKITLYGQNCAVLAAHIAEVGRRAGEKKTGLRRDLVQPDRDGEPAKATAAGQLAEVAATGRLASNRGGELAVPCADGGILVIDRLQPDGRKPMDGKSFLNGYAK